MGHYDRIYFQSMSTCSNNSNQAWGRLNARYLIYSIRQEVLNPQNLLIKVLVNHYNDFHPILLQRY